MQQRHRRRQPVSHPTVTSISSIVAAPVETNSGLPNLAAFSNNGRFTTSGEAILIAGKSNSSTASTSAKRKRRRNRNHPLLPNLADHLSAKLRRATHTAAASPPASCPPPPPSPDTPQTPTTHASTEEARENLQLHRIRPASLPHRHQLQHRTPTSHHGSPQSRRSPASCPTYRPSVN